jgi:hypothetical protein
MAKRFAAVVNKTYHALIVLFDNRLAGELIKILAQRHLLARWNEPSLTTTGLRPTDLSRESAQRTATMRAVHPLAKNPFGETVRIGAD